MNPSSENKKPLNWYWGLLREIGGLLNNLLHITWKKLICLGSAPFQDINAPFTLCNKYYEPSNGLCCSLWQMALARSLFVISGFHRNHFLQKSIWIIGWVQSFRIQTANTMKKPWCMVSCINACTILQKLAEIFFLVIKTCFIVIILYSPVLLSPA